MVLNKSVILTTVTISRRKRVKFVLLLLNTYITSTPKNRLAEAKSVLTDIAIYVSKQQEGKCLPVINPGLTTRIMHYMGMFHDEC